MKLKLRRIDPIQAGKMLAALYGLMSLLFIPFMLVFMALGSFAARQQGAVAGPPMPLMFGMGIGFVIFLPIIYAVMGFIGGVVGAAVYNLLAGWIGGFAVEFESGTEAPPPL